MLILPINNIQNHNYSNEYNVSNLNYKNINNKLLSFTGDDSFNYDERLKQKLENRSLFQKIFGLGKKKAIAETYLEVVGFNSNKDTLLRAKEELLRTKAETVRAVQEDVDVVNQILEDAQQDDAASETVIAMQEKKAKLEEQLNKVKKEYAKEADRFNKFKQEQAILDKIEADGVLKY